MFLVLFLGMGSNSFAKSIRYELQELDVISPEAVGQPFGLASRAGRFFKINSRLEPGSYVFVVTSSGGLFFSNRIVQSGQATHQSLLNQLRHQESSTEIIFAGEFTVDNKSSINLVTNRSELFPSGSKRFSIAVKFLRDKLYPLVYDKVRTQDFSLKGKNHPFFVENNLLSIEDTIAYGEIIGKGKLEALLKLADPLPAIYRAVEAAKLEGVWAHDEGTSALSKKIQAVPLDQPLPRSLIEELEIHLESSPWYVENPEHYWGEHLRSAQVNGPDLPAVELPEDLPPYAILHRALLASIFTGPATSKDEPSSSQLKTFLVANGKVPGLNYLADLVTKLVGPDRAVISLQSSNYFADAGFMVYIPDNPRSPKLSATVGFLSRHSQTVDLKFQTKGFSSQTGCQEVLE